MTKMRAMVVRERGGPFVAEERDIPVAGPEEIRVGAQACGVRHSDIRAFPGMRSSASSMRSARGSKDSKSASVRAASAAIAGATRALLAKTSTS